MRDDSLDVVLLSDGKNYYIRPSVQGKNMGYESFAHVTEKLNCSCGDAALGEAVLGAFHYIEETYKNDEEFDMSDNSPKISWRKSGNITVTKYGRGEYEISLEYYNHEIMSLDIFERRKFPADISAEEFGGAINAAMKQCFDYADRKEFEVYHSESEGLLFIPMAVNRTGYVLNDFCRHVPKPYAPADVKKAVEDVLAFISENPEDKRTNRERKESLPWREYSKYKSTQGFIKTHHSIEMHRLINGSFVFIPKLRFDQNDCHYRHFDNIRTVRGENVTEQELTDEIFAALERSRLISEKAKEPCGVKNERFFEYLDELKRQIDGISS